MKIFSEIMAKLKAKKTRLLYTANYNQQRGGSMNFPVYRAYRGRGGNRRGIWRIAKSIFRKIAPHAKKIGISVGKRAWEKGRAEGKKVLAGEKKIGAALKSLARNTAVNLGTSTLKELTGGQRRKTATKRKRTPAKKNKKNKKKKKTTQRGGRRVAKKGVKRVGRPKKQFSDVFAQATRLGGKQKW